MLLYYVWFIYYTGVAIYKGSISVFLVVCREIYISVLGIRFVAQLLRGFGSLLCFYFGVLGWRSRMEYDVEVIERGMMDGVQEVVRGVFFRFVRFVVVREFQEGVGFFYDSCLVSQVFIVFEVV